MNRSPAARPASVRRQSCAVHGFTLLELLVVMSLLSVIMVGLVSALRSMAQTETKIDERVERLDEMRVARAFLQQTLSRVSAQTLNVANAPGKQMVPFVATSDSLSWVGIMPARPDLGGRHFFRVALEETGSERALVLRFFPWQPGAGFPDWSQAESRVLISGITQMTVQAQGLPPTGRNPGSVWPEGWQDGWPVADVLPEQVRLGLVDARGEWPEWNIALLALSQTDSSFARVAVGGGAPR